MSIDPTAAFDPVTVPGADGSLERSALLQAVAAWVDSAPMRALLDRFGGPRPDGDLTTRLATLERFTSSAWDFRRSSDGMSVERNQVHLDTISDPDTETLVRSAATALGLVTPRPPAHDSYDYLVILGGLVRANLWRSEHASYLLRSGGVKASKVVALTANRPLAANPDDVERDEFSLLDRLGLAPHQLESEVMEEALCRAFNLERLVDRVADRDDVPLAGRRRVASATNEDSTDVVLVVAPPADASSGRRADTAATYRFWAGEVDHIRSGARLLVVTSCIYVPYHALIALQHVGVPFGATVETVGYDDSVVDVTAAPQTFRAVNYLQEIRSTLRAAATLTSQLEASQ